MIIVSEFSENVMRTSFLISQGKRQYSLGVLVCALLLGLAFYGSTATAVTRCKVTDFSDGIVKRIDIVSPYHAPGIECSTWDNCPVASSCKYDSSSQKFTGCGALTTCVLQGEDPPVSSPIWVPNSLAAQSKGSTIISGKCGPPIIVGQDALGTARKGLNMTASQCGPGGSSLQICLPMPNCPNNIDEFTANLATAKLAGALR